MFTAGVRIQEVAGKKPLPTIYWIGKKDSVTIGYAFIVESRGGSGIISSIVGIDTAGTLMGIKILAEHRIPGQGVALEDRFPQRSFWGRLFGKKYMSQPWFIEQFKGTNVKKSFIIDSAAQGDGFSDSAQKTRREANMISAITGATISTRTIVQAIQKNALSFLLNVNPVKPDKTLLSGLIDAKSVDKSDTVSKLQER